MRYYVNGKCIGCGMCVATCSSVFRMTEAGQAAAAHKEVEPTANVLAKKAMAGCPVNAIEQV